jgi:phage-related protein
MAKGPQRKRIKVGVKEGGGPPPGYKWNVEILDQAFEEAMGFLSEDQYDHMADQVRELATQDDPTHSQTVDVRAIEDFYEIRDKGGVLRKISARVFFFTHKVSRTIVVLGALKKETNGPTPIGDKCMMRRRRRLYLEKLHSDS